MISGRVYLARDVIIPTGEPRVTVSVADVTGELHPFEFLVDTGFDGDITLPLEVIQRMRLPYIRPGRAILADNLEREFGTYGAEVSWKGRIVEVAVLQSEDRPPLLGMGLLWGSRLVVDAEDGGQVTIQDLSER